MRFMDFLRESVASLFVALVIYACAYLKAQELKEYLTSHGASFDDGIGTDGNVCRLVQAIASSFSTCLASASDEGSIFD